MSFRLALRTLLVTGILVLTAARFLHLDADFPWGMTWSTAPYTDEGFYTNGAVNKILTGHWRLAGDYNPMVTVPVYYLAQYVNLRLFGIGLTGARLTTLGFYLVLLCGTWVLVRRYAPPDLALAALVLVGANLHLFLYSRMAILDLPATSLVVAALVLAGASRGRGGPRARVLPPVLSGLAFSAAVLTKTSAIAALPGVLSLNAFHAREDAREGARDDAGESSRASGGRRRGIRAALAALGTAIIVLGGYDLVTNLACHEDRAYFAHSMLEPNISFDPAGFAARLVGIAAGARVVDRVLYVPALVAALVAWIAFRVVRRQALVNALLLWQAGFLVVHGAYDYLPDRYFVPEAEIVVLLTIVLVGLMLEHLRGRWRWLLVPAALAMGVSCFEGTRAIIGVLSEPRYSLKETAGDIRRRVEPFGASNVVLTGDCAGTIGLAAGLRSVSSTIGSRDPEWRFRTYRPTHYLQFVEDMGLLATLDEFGLLASDDREAEANLKRALADPERARALDQMGLIPHAYARDGKASPAASPAVSPWLEKARRRKIVMEAGRKRFYYMTDYASVEFLETLDRFYDPELLARYDLFGNRIHHRLYFFRLRPAAAVPVERRPAPGPSRSSR